MLLRHNMRMRENPGEVFIVAELACLGIYYFFAGDIESAWYMTRAARPAHKRSCILSAITSVDQRYTLLTQ
jgi:hypothetical protein